MENNVYKNTLKVLDKGKNIFLTGPAGVGKSYFVRGFVEYLKQNKRKVNVCSSTGISATHIGGITIHRLLKFGTQSSPDYIGKMMEGRYWGLLCKDVSKMDIIIIDEISMIRSDTLDLIDIILRNASFNTTKPFGGKKILFVGDFLQMPPVVKSTDLLNNPWAFQARSWNKGNILYMPLKKVKRQDDLNFVRALHNIRVGRIDQETLDLIEECAQRESIEGAVKFTPTNNEAESINYEELNKLPGKSSTYVAKVIAKSDYHRQQIINDVIAPQELELREGARVMTVKNDPNDNYYNGSLGVVYKLEEDKVWVKLDSGRVVILEESNWERKDINDKILATFKQIPLRLAYAITIHKSQGMTLDKAEIDCYNIFSEGQLYVSMSRVRTKEGLVLRGFDKDRHIKTNPYALEFYNRIAA